MKYYKNLSLESLFYVNKNGLVCQEEWFDIPEFIGKYQISTLGRVKSLERTRIHKKRGLELIKSRVLKQTISGNDRLFVSLWKNRVMKTFSVSLIMGEIFFNHKYCKIKQELVDHDNNNPLDNRLENLQIITHRKNCSKDKTNSNGFTGVHKDKNKFRAMIDFNNVRYNLGSFYSPEEAYSKYSEAVSLIELKQSFLHLVNPINTEPSRIWSKLTKEQVLEIRVIGGNLTLKIIAEIYNISCANVSDILNKKTWKNI
jgi:hypothetical protein